MPSPRAIVLDLDGTLVDSVPDLAYSVDRALDQLGLPERGEEQVRMWVGNGAERLVKRALTGTMDGEPDVSLFERAFPLFMDIYGKNTSDRSRLYPGVRDGLARLTGDGYRLACVTNKPARFTEPLLDALGIATEFELIVCGDTLPRKKPDPMPLIYAAQQLGVSAGQALMVGDSVSDVQAARAAGWYVICVSYGYNHGRDIREAGPDAVVDSLAQLPTLLAEAA
jgi:phosphoglycolate phosphatase